MLATFSDGLDSAADGSPPADAVTSLRLPLELVDASFEVGSMIIFYATAPGAFIDLAADLTYALRGTILLDADLPTTGFAAGVTGLTELSTINRALGVLIDRGEHPSHVHATLRRRAAAAGQLPHAFALELLSE